MRIGQPLRTVLALGGLYLAAGLVLRGVLWASFGQAEGVSPGQLGWILPAGAAADAIECLYLLAPFAAVGWLLPRRWRHRAGLRGAWLAAAWLLVAAVLFTAVAEYFFFEEFSARFNLVAVDYLLYPTEVIGDLRAEYPLVPALAAAALLAGGLVFALRRWVALDAGPAPARHRQATAIAVYGLALIAAVSSFETSALALTSNRVANELAANGLSSFFRALRTSEIDYHAFYATRPDADNRAALRRQLGLDENLLRDAPADPAGLGRLNVVVLVCESFGAEFSALHGAARDWTPQVDRIARQGLRFASTFATGTRTVRGLEAIVTSLPPIPTVSILHRPGSEHVADWGEVMRRHGYQASFLYGGYGDFDDMNRFFAGNGFTVLDRRAIEGPTRFENIWGVSDEDLYDLALRHFDERSRGGAPFFAVVMNTSNHKPYTFREGVPGVQAAGGGRESGVRYADFAIGYFMAEAARRPWFGDTLFVIVADHGARVYGSAQMPVDSYRIPFVLYAPGRLAPGVIEAPTSQIDVAPTVLGVLGLAYTAPFYGRDARLPPAADPPVPLSHNHDVALLRGDDLAILGLHGAVHHVRRDPATGGYADRPPDRGLETLAVAYYQTAYERFRAGTYQLPPADERPRVAAASVARGDR